MDAKRAAKKQRAGAIAELERDELQKHLDEQDARLKHTLLQKEAREQKRLNDLTPPRREMTTDRICALAAKIPGPGKYSPRLSHKDSEGGKTFGAMPFGPGSRDADRDAGSLDSYRVKVAAQMPGPASYSPRLSGGSSSTFGLSPELRQQKDGTTRQVPDAHDMSKMVSHLRDLPAPGAYSPRNPMERNKGFRMAQSKTKTMLEQAVFLNSWVPGPGTYEAGGSLSPGRSTLLGSGGKVKSMIEMEMIRAAEVPGPGHYNQPSTLRHRGSPRFATGGAASMIETIMEDARTKPGPGTYHKQPTFHEELVMQKYKRDVVRGAISI